MHETKIKIPFKLTGPESRSNEIDHGYIVGVLHQKKGHNTSPSYSSSRSITLILHGNLSHKDQLFHRKLANSLPMDSFRFDFRHAIDGGESVSKMVASDWSMINIGEDVLDIHVVTRFLRQRWNYHVECIVAHSRGALDAWMLYWDIQQRLRERKERTHEDYVLDFAPLLVALSGTSNIDNEDKEVTGFDEEIRAKGFVDCHVKVAGKPFSVRINAAMINDYLSYPVKHFAQSFPSTCDVLLVHGDQDETAPGTEAYHFQGFLNHISQPYPRRLRPGSTQLYIIAEAGHTFIGHFDELVQVICKWINERRDLALTRHPTASEALCTFLTSNPLSDISCQQENDHSSSKDSKL